MEGLLDSDIRPVLFDLYELSNEKLRIFEEFNIGKSRADAILVTDKLTGFEIKSDHDSLERLSRQMKDYNRYCDENYVVAGTRLLEKAREQVPAYWGIFHVYINDTGELALECVRKAQKNPKVKLHNQLRLLWRNELVAIVKRYKLGGVTTRNKVKLIALIEEKLPEDVIRREMIEELMEREYGNWGEE